MSFTFDKADTEKSLPVEGIFGKWAGPNINCTAPQLQTSAFPSFLLNVEEIHTVRGNSLRLKGGPSDSRF